MPEEFPPTLFEVALDKIHGTEFEEFSSEIMSAVLGTNYVPLGGQNDGGADGFLDDGCFESNVITRFLQASIVEGTAAKIRSTVNRLREVGRNPEVLIYTTSRVVPRIDQLQMELGEELGLNVMIRDQKWFASNGNSSARTKAICWRYLKPLVVYLNSPGSAKLIDSSYLDSPSIFVFLRQEVERRSGTTGPYDAVVDALILWALEGTDPDLEIFMTRSEVRGKIESELPIARQMLDQLLDVRIEHLSSKENESGREVRWHRKRDLFCLPFETRESVEEENEIDESVRICANDAFRSRLTEMNDPALDSDEVEQCVKVVNRAVQLAFEREGLSFSHFLEESESKENSYSLSDHVLEAMQVLGVRQADSQRFGEAAYKTIRESIYHSDIREREYFRRLSRTYGLLFTLKCDPAIIKYFQEMSGDLNIYVGADILVKALSERYLHPEDRMIRNMLQMAHEAGARLVLTEPILGEVWNHLKACDQEIRYELGVVQDEISLEVARGIPFILMRAYFYAKLEPESHDGSPHTWEQYVQQICNYGDLHRPAGKESVRKYLQTTFSMDFVTKEDLLRVVDINMVNELATKIEPVKRRPELAFNDALMALAIYGIRQETGESTTVSTFGYRTWWLTNESAMLRQTHELVSSHASSRYMMRPDFLLNYLSLAPSAEHARQTFANVFPTTLSVRLSRRISEEDYVSLIEKVTEWKGLEDGRRSVAISEWTDKLKGDFERQYLTQMGRQ
jgi:hypothetical protein